MNLPNYYKTLKNDLFRLQFFEFQQSQNQSRMNVLFFNQTARSPCPELDFLFNEHI